ncbi:MAG: DUF1304 domain-containing protein [Rhizobiaceae bacterium]
MRLLTTALVALIALLHTYIAWFEMFAWQSRGPKVFSSFPAELFAQTTAMAANQGLYNAFLAAGLFWSLLIADHKWKINVAACFLIFVAVAGIFGAYTVTLKTLYIQTVPAAIALILLYFSRKDSTA